MAASTEAVTPYCNQAIDTQCSRDGFLARHPDTRSGPEDSVLELRQQEGDCAALGRPLGMTATTLM